MENLNESTCESSIDRNDFFSFLQSKDAEEPGIKLAAEVDVIDLESEEEDQDEVSILLSESKDTCEESYNTTEESCHDEANDLVEIVLSSDSEDGGFDERIKTLVKTQVSSTIQSLSENVSNLDRDATNIDQMLDKSKIGLDNLRILLENNNVSVDNVSKTQHEDSLDLSIDILDEEDFEVEDHAIVDDDQNSVFVQCKV